VLLAKLGQHADPARRSRQGIEIVERVFELVAQRRKLEPHALHRGHEALVFVDRDGRAVHGRAQKPRRALMHVLVLEPDLGKAGMALEPVNAGLVKPLAEAAQAMSVLADVALIGRETADQGAVNRLSPLLVIVKGLLELAGRRAHLVVGHVGDRHRSLVVSGAAE
jgi:hypothetical protein